MEIQQTKTFNQKVGKVKGKGEKKVEFYIKNKKTGASFPYDFKDVKTLEEYKKDKKTYIVKKIVHE